MASNATANDDWLVGTNNPATTVLFPWTVETLGVIVSFLLTRYEWPVPSAAVMFVIGSVMGIGAVSRAPNDDDNEQTSTMDQLSSSILQWSNISSSVLLLVFLPGLIFRDAIEVNFTLFRKALPQILLLAFPMVLVGTALTAFAAFFVMPYDFHWSLAATLGSILASTDPVAVGSVLKSAGAPPRLQMLISGESLLNDGSAVVFFSIFSQIYLSQFGITESVGWGDGVVTFLRMSLGGIAVGFAFSMGLLLLLYELDQRLEPEYDVFQVVAALSAAFLSYYTSEQVCQMSGVIACVVCGITSRALGRGLIRDHKLMDSYLKLMEYLLNTLLFTLGGVVWGKVIAERNAVSIEWVDWMYLIVLYILVMVIRFFQVGLFFPIFSRVGLRSDWKEAAFLGYGGLRGAVGIALALSLNRSAREATEDRENLRNTEALEFMAGGVTLATLLINGSTAGPVLRLLGLAKSVLSRKQAVRIFEASAKSFVSEEYLKILSETRFANTNFNVVKAHVPFISNEPKLSESQLERRASTYDIESDSAPYQRLLEVSVRQCPAEAVVEMRMIFLELLHEAYSIETKNSELDERDDNGLNLDVLQQSVDVALIDVGRNECIHDWDYTNSYALSEDAKSYLIRKFRGWTGKPQTTTCCSFDFQKERSSVLRAISFLEAHRIADRKLFTYVGSIVKSQDISGSLHADRLVQAAKVVQEESAKQSDYAREIVDSHPKAGSILSHYVSTILLRRLALFVEQNAADGILTKKEAKAYLHRIDQNIGLSKTCDNEYKYPTDWSNEEEDDLPRSEDS